MVYTIVILAVSLSIDSLGVGIAYGIRKVNIPLVSKLIICLFSIIYSGIAIILGRFMYTALPPAVSKIAGVTILSGMGIYILFQALAKKEKPKATKKAPGITMKVLKDPKEGDLDKSGVIDIRESLLLGFALSIDAIGAGVGSALAGLGSVMVPFAIGLFQLLFLYGGLLIGRKAAALEHLNKRFLSLAPGLLLLMLALLRIK